MRSIDLPRRRARSWAAGKRSPPARVRVAGAICGYPGVTVEQAKAATEAELALPAKVAEMRL